QTTSLFPSSRPPAAASCFLASQSPSPLSCIHRRPSAKTSSATIAAPCAIPVRALGRRVRVSTSPHRQSVFSSSSPSRNICFVILPYQAPDPLPAVPILRQRDTFVPPADSGRPAHPLPFLR